MYSYALLGPAVGTLLMLRLAKLDSMSDVVQFDPLQDTGYLSRVTMGWKMGAV